MPYMPTTDSSFEEIVLYVLAGIVLIICLGCVYAFFRAIILFVFSNGKNEKIQAAWSSIRYMILGMFFTILFLFAAPTLLQFMHVRGAEQYTAKNVFSYMGKIITNVTTLGNIFKESQKSNKYEGNLYYDI